MVFLRHVLFCLLDISLQRYDSPNFEKNAFFTRFTVVHNFCIAISHPKILILFQKVIKYEKVAKEWCF